MEKKIYYQMEKEPQFYGLEKGNMKGTKIIRWRTPKYIQRLKKSFSSFPSKKPKKYCRKLKGEHQFELVEKEWIKWFKEWMCEYRCVGCRKKKIEIKKDINEKAK